MQRSGARCSLWERNSRDTLGGRYQIGCDEGRVGQEAMPSSTSDADGRACPSYTKHVNTHSKSARITTSNVETTRPVAIRDPRSKQARGRAPPSRGSPVCLFQGRNQELYRLRNLPSSAWTGGPFAGEANRGAYVLPESGSEARKRDRHWRLHSRAITSTLLPFLSYFLFINLISIITN